MTSLRSWVKLTLMKKLSTYLFLFLFSFSAPSFADDISDFEIEGMSIGDSALDFFSEEEIKNNIMNYYNDDKFSTSELNNISWLTLYDSIGISFKTEDYAIYEIIGHIHYSKNINDCYQKMDEIIESINNVVPNVNKSSKETSNLNQDKSGNSKLTSVEFYFDSGRSHVGCYDWSIEKGWIDHLRVVIALDEFIDWSINNLYKK